MERYKHVLSLVPGDVVGDENCPLHNGDGRVVKTVCERDLTGAEWTVYFADGSATTTAHGERVVPVVYGHGGRLSVRSQYAAMGE